MSRRCSRLCEWALRTCEGPPGLDGPQLQEWRFTLVRWPAIVFVGLGLPLAHLQLDGLREAYGLLVFAAAYNAVLTVLLRRRHPLLRGGYLSSGMDAAMNLAMIGITGGFETPFYFIIYTVVAAAAMRYGYGAALLMSSVFVLSDGLSRPLMGGGLDTGFFLRSGFLVITGVLAGYLREQATAAERALQARVSQLQEAYRDLAAAHEQLLTLDNLKTSFLANVSHELRTPLTSIRAFSEMLFDYAVEPETVREFAGIITTESERLTRLIDDVLDLAKIEAGQMDWHVEPLDLADLIHACGRQIEPVLASRGLKYRESLEDALPPVPGDRDRLQQVLMNLLSNAAKFTRAGGVHVGASMDRDTVNISVADTGIGIAAEDLARVFDKFQQVGDTLTDKPTGTGLGLAICRDIITHHHGRIWAESEPGRGSTFYVSLPLRQAEGSPSVADPANASGASGEEGSERAERSLDAVQPARERVLAQG